MARNIQIREPGNNYGDVLHPETNSGMVLMENGSTLQEDLDAHKADNTYQTPVIVGTQIQIQKKSDTKRLYFKLDADLNGGAITISLDKGTTDKPLMDIDGAPVTELPKGFVEVVENEVNFTYAPKGGKNQGAIIITPSTVNQAIPKGIHNGLGYVKGDANLISSNVLRNKTIFNVAGSVVPFRSYAPPDGVPNISLVSFRVDYSDDIWYNEDDGYIYTLYSDRVYKFNKSGTEIGEYMTLSFTNYGGRFIRRKKDRYVMMAKDSGQYLEVCDLSGTKIFTAATATNLHGVHEVAAGLSNDLTTWRVFQKDSSSLRVINFSNTVLQTISTTPIVHFKQLTDRLFVNFIESSAMVNFLIYRNDNGTFSKINFANESYPIIKFLQILRLFLREGLNYEPW